MAKKDKKQEVTTPKGRPVPKEIRIRLSKQQIDQRFDQAAGLTQERMAVEKEFEAEEKEWKRRRAEYKNRVKNLQQQADKLQTEAKSKEATITDNCILVLNHECGIAEYWYKQEGMDWGIKDTRPLEDNERQLSLVQDKVDAMPDDGQEVEA